MQARQSPRPGTLRRDNTAAPNVMTVIRPKNIKAHFRWCWLLSLSLADVTQGIVGLHLFENIQPAAARMAFLIRAYVPHRQMLVIDASISAGLGFGC